MTLDSVDVPGRDGVEMGRPLEAEPPAAESSEEGPNGPMAVGGQAEGEQPAVCGDRAAPGNGLSGTASTADPPADGRPSRKGAGSVFVSSKEKIKEKIRILFFAHNQVR